MGKLTNGERSVVKSLVATLSLKRILNNEIIKQIFNQTNKIISSEPISPKPKLVPINLPKDTLEKLRTIVASDKVAPYQKHACQFPMLDT